MAHFLIEVQVKGKPNQDVMAEYRAFLARITQERALLLAGTLKVTPGKALAIVKAASAEAAEALYSEAPTAKHGIVNFTVTEITLSYGIAVGLDGD